MNNAHFLCSIGTVHSAFVHTVHTVQSVFAVHNPLTVHSLVLMLASQSEFCSSVAKIFFSNSFPHSSSIFYGMHFKTLKWFLLLKFLPLALTRRNFGSFVEVEQVLSPFFISFRNCSVGKATEKLLIQFFTLSYGWLGNAESLKRRCCSCTNASRQKTERPAGGHQGLGDRGERN